MERFPFQRLCKERIWNQGKAIKARWAICPDCAKSGFGIKAKLVKANASNSADCAKSGFGIKAKPGFKSRYPPHLLCKERIWNQGKAVVRF